MGKDAHISQEERFRAAEGRPVHATLYRALEKSPYRGNDLKNAIEKDGPMKRDYRKILDADITACADGGILGQIVAELEKGYEGGKPVQSDVLVLTTETTGTNAYYLTRGAWKHVLFL